MIRLIEHALRVMRSVSAFFRKIRPTFHSAFEVFF